MNFDSNGDVWMKSFLAGWSAILWECFVYFLSRFLGKGSDEALVSEEKGLFSEKEGGIQWKGGFGKDFYRKGNSVKRSGPFSEPPDPKIEKLLSKSTSQKSAPIIRGQKLHPNLFFSNFSGASGISRQNPGISRQKSLIPWVSRDIPNFLAPTPSCGRPLPHRKISGLKSLGLGSFFVPE